MDSTILAAIIGGLCTFGASIVAVLVTRYLDNPMGLQKNKRRIALAGQWDGIVHQEVLGPEGTPADHHITLLLKPKGRTILGEGSVHLTYQNRTTIDPITVTGGFVHDRFLKLEYTFENQPGTIQFGYSILELNPNGQTLSGKFIGYGAIATGNMISGTVQLHKQGSILQSNPTSHAII